jgi:glycosyltransferase involved in cell wall biosynthesis
MNGRQEGGYRLSGKIRQGEPNRPLISIVTVTYNAEKYLQQTIESVLGQSYSNIEYILIDGGSKDATIDIIKAYDTHIAYWVSEPDKGIYDAMNKGILLATGQFVGMKNADDWYLPRAVEEVVNCFLNTRATVIYGNSLHVVQEQPLLANLYTVSHLNLGKGSGLDHRSMFVDTAWHQQNQFDLRYKLAADYDVMLRLKYSGQAFAHTQTALAHKRAGGASYAWKLIAELAAIDWKYGNFLLAVKRLSLDTLKYFMLKYGNQLLLKVLGENGYARWKTRKQRR